MYTPWGNLEDLNLNDRTLAEEILCADKHQLVEGLIVECLFDQFLDSLPTHDSSVIALNVETVIAQAKHWNDKKIAVVWAREKGTGLGRYLKALEARFHVFLVEYSPGYGFYGSPIRDGERVARAKHLDDLMKSVATIDHTPFSVSKAVRDKNRQLEAIWGFLFAHHGKNLASNVLLPRILINCGVQPWFKYVWNLDRIFIVDGKPWLFEVKHKFPYHDQQSATLKFGLNDGEVSMFRLLSECGIGTLFSIMVKPKWSKDVGSLYMMTDLTARNRTAVIGKVLDAEVIRQLSMKSSGVSNSDTTITGNKGSQLRFKRLLVSDFGMLGRFSDRPAEIAKHIVSELRGSLGPRVRDEELLELRMPF